MSTSQHDTDHDGQSSAPSGDGKPTSPVLITLAWLLVSVPLAYGLWQTLVRAAQLLGG